MFQFDWDMSTDSDVWHKDLVEILDLISNSEADSLSKARPLKVLHYLQVILYNYRLLMCFTRDHEDPGRYWLTEATGRGLPIHSYIHAINTWSLLPQVDKNKKKSYGCYCFIKL